MTESTVRVRAERFVAGGAALGRTDDGRVVFVRGGVPGDTVDVQVDDDHRSYAQASVVDVIAAGDDRVVPPCPQRLAGCGGCDWQHVAVERQLDHKVGIVTDALRRTARLPDADVRVGASVPPQGYRTTVRVIGDADGRPSFRIERSHGTVPAAGCLVAHPLLDAALRTPIEPGAEITYRASAATGEVTGVPGGPAHLTERVAGADLRVSAEAFFQSGPDAAELLVDAVRRAAPELTTATHVLDAYAGVGLFAATVVPAGARVTTIESSPAAVADSRVNLADRPATIFAAEVGRWKPAAVDVVIADPARTGLAKPGTRALAAAGAPVFVLVSCDPASLARDAGLLAEQGYRLDYTEVLDLFPHTHHVETVTRFVRTAD